jgi:hypothetical protein
MFASLLWLKSLSQYESLTRLGDTDPMAPGDELHALCDDIPACVFHEEVERGWIVTVLSGIH